MVWHCAVYVCTHPANNKVTALPLATSNKEKVTPEKTPTVARERLNTPRRVQDPEKSAESPKYGLIKLTVAATNTYIQHKESTGKWVHLVSIL